jgi:ubiquinone/menaquinone biosynthesis C-methylase UbiE
MKKYIITALCTLGSLNAMMEKQPLIIDRKPVREPREWDAKAYEEGNKLQTTTFLHYINTNNVNIENKKMLSVACGTGTIENILTEEYANGPASIHGFDASKNMIKFAQNKYGNNKKLSFEYCFAEDFTTQKLYQLAIASFCIHWFEDKKQAFQRINDSLEIGGEFFGTIATSENPKPKNLVVFLEMAETIDWLCQIVTNTKLEDLIGSSYPSETEVRTMLDETNFEIITCEAQPFSFTFKDREALEKTTWPILSSRPIVKLIPGMFIEPLFKKFIDRMIEKLTKNEDGSFTDTSYKTIIHARKKQK